MLNKVKLALRITSAAFDEEINDLIDAAKADLVLSGVIDTKANDETDVLILRAIITYCKANFGLNNVDSEKFQRSYDMIKQHLSLSLEYTGGDVVV